MNYQTYKIKGMTCASCQAHVEKAAGSVTGVEKAEVSLLTDTLKVEGNFDAEDVIQAVQKAGYGARISGSAENKQTEDPIEGLKKRLRWSLPVLLMLMYFSMGHTMLHFPVPAFMEGNPIAIAITECLLSIVVMRINEAFFTSGFRALRNRTPNMDTLVALGSSVSFAWSLYVLFEMTMVSSSEAMHFLHSEMYFESAAMIPALITIGKTLESKAKRKTGDALKALAERAPVTAVVVRDGKESEIKASDLRIGDILIIKGGQAVPADGTILEGTGSLDESALSGESVPVDKTIGDRVSAATICTSGYLKVKAEKVNEETVFAGIVRMVQDAASSKAPIARIADRVSGVFVPAVMIVALAVLIGWMLAGKEFSYALERGIAVLVVSCPCALGLATPVAVMAACGTAYKNGILFRNGEALENTGKTNIVVVDKTGTVTEGKPSVSDAVFMESEAEFLSTAASLESCSDHPLAHAVTEYTQERGIRPDTVTDYKEEIGHGLSGKIAGMEVHAGSVSYIRTFCEIPAEVQEKCDAWAEEGRTPVGFEKNGILLGVLAIFDKIRPDSKDAICALKNMGCDVVMLTGDHRKTAETIAGQAGTEHVICEVLPAQKAKVVEALKEYGNVMMIGDGINDAPALVNADIGTAIGAGTDVAIGSADVVLMNSSLPDAAASIRLSKAAVRNIYENLFWAFGYNVLLIPMAAGLYPGFALNPMWCAAAMSLSSFTVCMNALRLTGFRLYDTRRDKKNSHACVLTDAQMKEVDAKKEIGMETKLLVEGMMCPMCEKHVVTALKNVEGVEEARADHTTGEVVITSNHAVKTEDLEKAVAEAGYTVRK